MLSSTIKTVGKFLVAALFLGGSSSAWSSHVSNSERLLDPSYYNFVHAPRIDFTDISLNYNRNANLFTGVSKSSSTFTLLDPNSVSRTFTGTFIVTASITPSGTLNRGGFAFVSNDPYFGFRNSFGNYGNVFSGDLTSVGWSASRNFLEFDTRNFKGWACDQGWCTDRDTERLWFTEVDGLPNTAWNTSWRDRSVNGTAVIPVPAAAWLLGSGLVGLLGIGRRKKA